MNAVHGEKQYLDLLQDILDNGFVSTDRTGVGTKRVFGRMLKFDVEESFPLLTTKQVGFKTIIRELLWFISEGTNIRPLVMKNCNIWNEWPLKHYLTAQGRFESVGVNTPAWREEMKVFVEKVKEDPEFAAKWGELGPVYGKQWRAWVCPDGKVVDQLAKAIANIKSTPDSRRLIVSSWNVADLEAMEISGLPPCHLLYQFAVTNGKLHLGMYQRSVDSFLGLPFNIASYAALLYLVAHVTDLKPAELTLFLWDTHIYKNHVDAVTEQLSRLPYPFPKLEIVRKVEFIDDFTEDDLKLVDYVSHPSIKAEIAV